MSITPNPCCDETKNQGTYTRVTLLKCINTRLFFFFFPACGSSAPVRVEHEGGGSAWLVGTLVAPSVQGHRLPPWQELWPYQSLFLSLL